MMPKAILSLLAERCRQLRLARNEPQEALARRARVGLATIKRFERTGKINTEGFARIIFALGRDQDFANVLLPIKTAGPGITIEQLEKQQAGLRRRRARPKASSAG